MDDYGTCVRLVIPSGNEQEIAPIIGRIVGRWGGCTITSGNGWWADKDGVPVRDELSVVEVSGYGTKPLGIGGSTYRT